MIPDRDMEIAAFLDWELAEAMTYQDRRRYDEGYLTPGEPPIQTVHLSINAFLGTWLDALAKQRHVLRADGNASGNTRSTAVSDV